MQVTLNRKHAGFAMLALAVLGVPLAGFDSGCQWQRKDPVSGEWREATQTEMTGFANETGEIVRTTIAGTPLAPVLPWVDAVVRLLALFAAWRVIPTPKIAATPAANTKAVSRDPAT
jgi:hypothetical protein